MFNAHFRSFFLTIRPQPRGGRGDGGRVPTKERHRAALKVGDRAHPEHGIWTSTLLSHDTEFGLQQAAWKAPYATYRVWSRPWET